jgi:hypothetical protein
MLLTRIWGVILAALASVCLGGMFLLSQSSSGDFGDADKTALRAVTEAGLAALEAQIESSAVVHVRSLPLDPPLREAMARTPEQEAKLPPEKYPLAQVFTEASEALRVRHKSDMTTALIDAKGAIAAVSGIGEPSVVELIGSAPFQDTPADEEATFSLNLAGQIQVVQLLAADANGRRLIAFEPLQIGAGSLLRRVIGTESPAALVRDGKIIGDIIGDQPVSAEIEKLAQAHVDDAPDSGASKVLTLGSGLDARIGALGRVPGPAGKTKKGAMLVVLSRRTAAAAHRDLTDALAQARDKGLVSTANWVLLGLLLVLCAALAVYLPQLEALGPMRRLAAEFVAVSRGAQHQIFHDRYGGPTGEVARAANAAHEALRAAYLAELEIDEEVAEEAPGAAARPARPKTVRGRKLTRSMRRVEDTPSGHDASPDEAGPTTPVATTQARRPTPVSAAPLEPAPAPAPVSPPSSLTVAAPTVARTPLPRAQPAAQPSMPSAPAAAPPATSPPAKPAVAPAPAAARPAVAERPPAGSRPAPAVAPPPAASAPPLTPTETPGEDDDDERTRYYREIFEEFLQVKIACGEPTDGFTFDKFEKKLQKNTQDILDKHSDVRDVQFTVYVKDGKAALKAKIIRGSSTT